MCYKNGEQIEEIIYFYGTLLIAIFSLMRFINGMYSSDACISIYSAKAAIK